MLKPKFEDYKKLPDCGIHSLFAQYAKSVSKPDLVLYVKFKNGDTDSYSFEPAQSVVKYKTPCDGESYEQLIDNCRFNGDFLYSYAECKENKEYTSKAAILKRLKAFIGEEGKVSDKPFTP